jgi:hypothetical protein
MKTSKQIIETVPLVRADGTREYVSATPDVVTPPTIKKEEESHFEKLREVIDQIHAATVQLAYGPVSGGAKLRSGLYMREQHEAAQRGMKLRKK